MVHLLAVFAFIFGAVMMSFFGVVISRVPKNESIVTPPSHCENCGERIKWYDNIPIVSYLLLKGKCRYCHSKIGLFSFVYEFIGGLVLFLIVEHFKLTFDTLFLIFIFLVLLFIAGYDYKTYEVLDISWIIFLVLSIGYFLYLIFVNEKDYLNYLFAALIGFLFFGSIKVVGKLITKNDCLGGGDVIIMGIAGLFLGIFGLLVAILVSSLLGSIIEIIKLKITKKESKIPFTPYLVFGILFSSLLIEVILDYLLLIY